MSMELQEQLTSTLLIATTSQHVYNPSKNAEGVHVDAQGTA